MTPPVHLIFFMLSVLAMPGAAAAQASADTYQYDALGRLVKVQNGNGYKSDYAFDSAGNRSVVSVQRQLDTNSSAETWEAETLPHATGYAQFAGWAVNASSPIGAMTYGPYTNSLSAGNHTAVWKIMIDNNTNPASDTVVVLDVNDPELDQVIASRVLTWKSFAAPMAYQIFELPFTTAASQAGHHLEFRTWHYRRAYVNVDKVARY